MSVSGFFGNSHAVVIVVRAGMRGPASGTPDAVRACVSLARTTAASHFLVEVSGGIAVDTVRAYADAGADLISTSAITQSAAALDLAFDLRPDAGVEEG